MVLSRFLQRLKRKEKADAKSESSTSHLESPGSDVSSIGWPQRSKASSNRTTPTGWIEAGDSVTVAGRKIGGMIYCGQSPFSESHHWGGCPFINPDLSVEEVGSDVSGETMPYWPSYSHIGPQARATYLDWLATGRSDKRYGPGYVFIYFYGLERRFFVDAPTDEERHLLVAETERLLQVYGENHSIDRYLGAFLDVAQVMLAPDREIEPRIKGAVFELPLGLRVTIGRMAQKGLPLNANYLLAWYLAHPDYPLRTPGRRAFPEFRALFEHLFNEEFQEGLKIGVPKRTLSASYTAASGSFEVDLSRYLGNVPDISRISKPLNLAKKIVEEATDSLDRYSRFLGRNPEDRDKIEAHALLPESLWGLFPCADLEELLQWAEVIIGNGGFSPIEQVIEQLKGVQPENISKRQLTEAGDALARLSIGMAPDPRFALRSPKIGEPVVLFRLPEGMTALEEVSDVYRHILLAIAVGSLVARADGTITAIESSALKAMIDGADLPETELSRLVANLRWMMAVPLDLALLRRRLRDIPEDVPRELGRIALTVAAADGVIGSGEIKAIEKLYKAIGISTDGIYSALHSLVSRSEPVLIQRAGKKEPEYSIPPPPERDGKVILDPERVASVLTNTERVSSFLGDIFSNDDQFEDEPEETSDQDESGFSGLDAKHSAFLAELLTRPHWEEAEFGTLASQFRLMQAGAVETLNEWSFDRFGDVLIEEYEGYEMNPDLIEAIWN